MDTRARTDLRILALLSALACAPPAVQAPDSADVTIAAITRARSLLVEAFGAVDTVILARERVGFAEYEPVAKAGAPSQVPLDTAIVNSVVTRRLVDGSCASPAECRALDKGGLVVLTMVQMATKDRGAIRLLMWARQSHAVYELEFERVGASWVERRRDQLLIS